ncbi:MAG: hypothetical protein K0R02_1258 [Rickettsiaceae bacterium]|jgi:uncharacterized protein YneF (UPF0154 family)|nr:hypothetical protein [Rickettsiaceae bacterium]
MISTITSLAIILSGTPLWVWGILAYLLFVGIKSIKEHVVSLPKLFIIPLVLIGMKYKLFLHSGILIISTYILSLLLGVIIGFFLNKNLSFKIVKDISAIILPGSYYTIMILLSFFSVKYIFGYLSVVAPDLATKYFIIENFLSGIFTGYFLGRAFAFLYKFIRA